jgi:hypothetical protein
VLACQSPRWTVVAHERMAELTDALATHLQALVAMLALSDRHALGELELRVAEAMCRGEVHAVLAVQTARAAHLSSAEAHAACDRLHQHQGSEIAGCVERTREPHAEAFTSEDYDPLP